MRLLLDSHAFVWWLQDDPRLTSIAREAIAEPGSTVFVSAATVWELAIKAALGRINLGGADLVTEIAANGFSELLVSALHAARAGALPRVHDDPFDRMLVAQSMIEGLTCVTCDSAFAAYQVPVLW